MSTSRGVVVTTVGVTVTILLTWSFEVKLNTKLGVVTSPIDDGDDVSTPDSSTLVSGVTRVE